MFENRIPGFRVPLADLKGGITREWYRFFTQLFSRFFTKAIQFDISGANPAHSEGLLFYDYEDHSLSYYNESDGITVNLGREELLRVYNNTGSTIANGKLVYVNGAASAWPTVKLAQANTEIDSQSTIGMATETIASGEFGYICVNGIVHDLNTTGYTAGQVIYLSATSAGDFTATAPLQPNYVVRIGIVVESNATAGQVHIHVEKNAWYPSLELLDDTATVTLPTTPTVFKIPTTTYNDGFTYAPSTGVITFNTTGTYTLSLLLNCEPSAANKNVYFYAELDTGSGWSIRRYSARQLKLVNAAQTQMLIASSNYFATGTKLRIYLWGDATVYLKTTDLPGTTAGTVTIPAVRLLWA